MGLCGGLACGVTVCGWVWQSGDTAGRKRRWHQQLDSAVPMLIFAASSADLTKPGPAVIAGG
jgi:alpha-beta hydrolase superfamily lysophospholipase